MTALRGLFARSRMPPPRRFRVTSNRLLPPEQDHYLRTAFAMAARSIVAFLARLRAVRRFGLGSTLGARPWIAKKSIVIRCERVRLTTMPFVLVQVPLR